MQKLDSHIEFVKAQLEFQQRQILRFADEPRRVALHENSALQFRMLLGDLTELKEWIDTHPEWRVEKKGLSPKKISLAWEEIEDLPPEVLAELSISDSDKTEFNILSAIRALGGVASLDRIIIYLFKHNGELTKRTPLNQRIYRMTQKDMIFSVPGKKGIYSIEPMSEEDAASLS